jgi:hypothetical protein
MCHDFFSVIAACNVEVDRARMVIPGGSTSVYPVDRGIYSYSKCQENVMSDGSERVKSIYNYFTYEKFNKLCMYFFLNK